MSALLAILLVVITACLVTRDAYKQDPHMDGMKDRLRKAIRDRPIRNR